MSGKYSDITIQAKAHYDSHDIDEFYYHIWGSEDFHLGISPNNNESIFNASHNTVKTMAGLVQFDENAKALDIGSGYGGTARYLAKTYKCKVWWS